eukprot:365108-Alexandrium_andersonii.AAC.1
MCIRDSLRVGWPSEAPPGGWTRQHLVILRRRLHLMASIRKADLARRHGQCGSSRFWQPYRGGAQHATIAQDRTTAVQPGRRECSSSTCTSAAILVAHGGRCIPPPPCPATARPFRRGCTGQRPRVPVADLYEEGGGSIPPSRCKRPPDDNYHFGDVPDGELSLCTRFGMIDTVQLSNSSMSSSSCLLARLKRCRRLPDVTPSC